VKAISLWQPWASAIALGAKRIETRSWSTRYRGPIAIHAAQNGMGLKIAVQHERDLWCAVLCAPVLSPALRALPRGMLVAVAELVDVVPVERVDATRCANSALGEWAESQLGDYRPGRFAWLLEAVRPLPAPIPCRGRQSLFDVPYPLLGELTA
jgi:hypothetical protein